MYYRIVFINQKQTQKLKVTRNKLSEDLCQYKILKPDVNNFIHCKNKELNSQVVYDLLDTSEGANKIYRLADSHH